MNSHSQAGQDQFALETYGDRPGGVFLDIGCNDPVVHNNTLALEERGWVGMCVDCHPFDYSGRKAKFVQADVTQPVPSVLDFILEQSRLIDYLSVDADDASLAALKWLLPPCRYRCVTVEHDVYRVGPAAQQAIHELMLIFDYRRVRKDVVAPVVPGMPWSGQPFEDWYIL